MTGPESWTFTVPGEPFAWQRATVVRGVHFTPRKTADYQRLVGMVARQAYSGPPLSGAVSVDVVAVFPRLSTSRAKGREVYAVQRRHDVDNLAKSILDGITKAGLWADDGQVADLRVRKVRAALGEAPHVEVTVSRLRDNP